MSRRRLALLAVAAVLVVLFGGRWLALRYTDALWFTDLGQGARYRTLLLRAIGWQALTFVVAFAWFGAHTLGVYGSIGAVHLPRRLGNLEIDEAVPARMLRAVALGTAALLALATAYTFGDLDQYVALARTAVPFGRTDTVLHQDVSFYLAVLPLLEVLHLLASVMAILSALLVVGLYAITGSFAVSRRRVRITPHARTHLVILLAALALVVAWGFQLDAWQLVAGGGHDAGALSAADRTVRIPASHALAALALAVAAGSALALRWVRPALLFGLWATLGVATLLGRIVIPVMTEAWGAASDPALVAQISRDTDSFSRAGFGLTDGPPRVLAGGDVRPESAAALVRAAEGIYAWSGQPELPGRMLDDIQGDSTAMRIWSVTPVEARDHAGHLRPAAIAVAQTDILEAQRVMPRPRWTALHRDSMAWGGAPVALDASLRAGTPPFLSSLDPADSAPRGAPLRGGPARVRLLPHAAELAIVGPGEAAPGESTPGIQLRGLPRRLMLAWALQSPPLLDEHTSNADRVLYWRDVPSRLARLYPFAGFDPARATIVDGRLLWVIDGYLMSARFPLAEPVRWREDDVNYLTSPYVVTVDAVSGDTRFYMRPLANAFAASVARSSHVTPLPADSMPPAVRRSLRYPEGLATGQAAMLALRGVRDARGPTWSLAWPDTIETNHDAARIRPTVAIFGLDGEPPRTWHVVPIIDIRSNHLAALAAGSANAGGQLEMTLIRVAGEVPTPLGARARMTGAPALLAAPNLLSTPEREIRRGPMQPLVAPAAGTVVFAQLLFSTGRVGEPVRVEGVALLAGNRTGFGSDVPAAVRSLMRGEGEVIGAAIASAELGDARAAFLALDSARLAGDWERFGRAWVALRRALRLEPAPTPDARATPPLLAPRRPPASGLRPPASGLRP